MFRTALVLLFYVFLTEHTAAQVSNGSLSGAVVDPQNAAVVGAYVRVIEEGTNQEFDSVTGSSGFFRANLLPIGSYRVEISKTGFKSLVVEHIPVSAGADQGLGTLRFMVGEVSTRVEVPSNAALMESTQAQVSNTFGRYALSSFPNILENNGLDNLALSVAGVVDSRDLGFASSNGAQIAVNGLRGRSNDQQIDGQNNNDNLATGPSLALSDPEFVEEYQITTSIFSAEYGRNSGSVVNILTKSGTNTLHGSLYGSEGNWRFDALSKNQKLFEGLTQVPAFNDAFLGGTIGGAVVKNKLFFFAGADSEILNRSAVFGTGQLTPTPAGIATLARCFPESASVKALEIYGPYAVKAGKPAPEGPIAQMDFATCVDVDMAGIQRTLANNFREDSVILRLDYQTDKNHLYGRYIYSKKHFLSSGGNAVGGYPSDSSAFSQDYAFSWTRSVSAVTANEFRLSYGSLNSQDGGNSIGDTVPRPNQIGTALTFVTFNDPSLLDLGVPTVSPQGRLANTYQVQDNWTHLAGPHSLKAGINFSYLRSPNVVLPDYNGAYQFNDYGSFAENVPDRIQIASGNPYLDFREKDTFLYLADDFRASHNFTINLGLTWSFYGQPANLLHNLTLQSQTGPNPLWNPSLPLTVTTLPSLPAPKNSWGPGAGFAWSPDRLFGSGGKTVIRGGYRLAYDPAYYSIYLKIADSAPNVLLTTLIGADAQANPLPSVPTGTNIRALLGPHLRTGLFDPRTFSETSIAPNFGPDRVHQWSLGVQQQIVRNAVFEVRYTGNHAGDLFQTINGNPFILGLANTYPKLVPAGLIPCPASQAVLPQLVGRLHCSGGALVRERTNTGYSDYNGLQMELRSTSLWRQLTLRSAYTFSKTTDNTSEIGATGTAGNTSALSQSQVDFTSQEHGLSGLDFPHNWVLYVLEESPFERDGHGFLGNAFGGWRFSAVYTLSSGQPYTAVQFSLNCASGGGACGGIPSVLNPYDPEFDNAFALPDGSLRPFLGSRAAPVQSVGIFANDACAVDVNGNLCGNSAITPTTLINLNELNNGFTGTTTDAAGDILPDRQHPAGIVRRDQVHFVANTATAAAVFGTPFGNVRRNTLRDSRTNVVNFAAFKSVNISSTLKVEFHIDFLNAFNHSNPSSIDPFVDDAGLASENSGFANPHVQASGSRSIRVGLKIPF